MDVEFVFCGDTMLAAERLHADPFAQVRQILQGADVAFCNLETSLATDAARPKKRHVVMSHATNLEFLAKSGFAIVNLANNHVLDNGPSAAKQMCGLIERMGMKTLGLQESGRAKAVILERKRKKFGFLGYADYGFQETFMPMRERIALQDIRALKAVVDCVIVSLHWGYEYVDYPHPSQQALARRFIDCGAQLVIGHHPHVVQGVEEYNGGLIAYSLGNFQFRISLGDEFLSAGTGMMLRVFRSGGGAFRYEAVPVKVGSSGQVELSGEGDPGPVLSLARLADLTAAVNGKRMSQLTWMREASRLWFPSQLESWFFRIKNFGGLQWMRMLGWLLRPANLCYLLFYLVGPKHTSSRALFNAPH